MQSGRQPMSLSNIIVHFYHYEAAIASYGQRHADEFPLSVMDS